MSKIKFKLLPAAVVKPRDLILVRRGAATIVVVEAVSFRCDHWNGQVRMTVTIQTSDGHSWEACCDPNDDFGKIWICQSFNKLAVKWA